VPVHEILNAAIPRPNEVRLWCSIQGFPDWVAEATVMVGRFGPSLAELRLYPKVQDDGPDGTWSRDPKDLPPVSLPTRLLRRVNAGELLDLTQKWAREIADSMNSEDQSAARRLADADADFADYLARMDSAGSIAQPKQNVGRRGNGIDHYLTWAVRYADAIASGERHVHEYLSEKYEVSVRYSTDVVQDARRRYGLLTSGGQGRAGGILTEKALKLIRERNEEAG
jgi:hypothetical protein